MLDRRDFVIASGAAAAAWPLAAQASFATPVIAVADRRFSESAAFARDAARAGASFHWIDGDVTEFWYGTLDAAWRSRKTKVAGLTAPGALFCLERLAMDRGMRVVARQTRRPSVLNWVIA